MLPLADRRPAVEPPQTPLKLESFERALRHAPGGAALADAFAEHVEEVVALINTNRRVAVVWQRHQGPAFVRAVVRGIGAHDVAIPRQVNGASLEELLLHTADALQRHGSMALRRAIAEHSLRVLRWARECGSFDAVLRDLDAGRRGV